MTCQDVSFALPQRLYVVVPLMMGSTIAMLFATMVEFRFNYTAFFESLCVLYAVVAWETKHRTGFWIPLMLSIFVGGLLLGYWEPLATEYRHKHYLLTCPLDPCCGLSGVTFGLVGACVATFFTSLLLPPRRNKREKIAL